MNSSGHLPVSDSAARPNGKAKRGRPRKNPAANGANGTAAPREYAAVGTLTRTKSLLGAALKVWELKQRGLGS